MEFDQAEKNEGYGFTAAQSRKMMDQMLELRELGIEGFILSWLDYYEELKYFGERVLPLMKQAGLRV